MKFLVKFYLWHSFRYFSFIPKKNFWMELITNIFMKFSWYLFLLCFKHTNFMTFYFKLFLQDFNVFYFLYDLKTFHFFHTISTKIIFHDISSLCFKCNLNNYFLITFQMFDFFHTISYGHIWMIYQSNNFISFHNWINLIEFKII